MTLSLRAEWENGAKGKHDDYISGWDPDCPAAHQRGGAGRLRANTASQVPELAASNFIVKGGALYAGTSGAPDRAWNSQLMWLPRVGFGYQLDHKTVIRGGYGLYYDTLDVNALVYGPESDRLLDQHQHYVHHHQRRDLGQQRRVRQLVQPFGHEP